MLWFQQVKFEEEEVKVEQSGINQLQRYTLSAAAVLVVQEYFLLVPEHLQQ